MARRESTLFFLTIATLHLLFHTHTTPAVSAAAAPPQTTTLIQKTCRKTKYYNLCVATLKSDPASQAAGDAEALAAVVVGAAILNSNATSAFLSSLVTSTAASAPTAAKLLKDCADKYALAGDSLRHSGQDLAVEAYDYAYVNILAARDYPNACHNGFKRSSGRVAYPPELSRREGGLKRICDVALGIIDVLASQ